MLAILGGSQKTQTLQGEESQKNTRN